MSTLDAADANADGATSAPVLKDPAVVPRISTQAPSFVSPLLFAAAVGVPVLYLVDTGAWRWAAFVVCSMLAFFAYAIYSLRAVYPAPGFTSRSVKK